MLHQDKRKSFIKEYTSSKEELQLYFDAMTIREKVYICAVVDSLSKYIVYTEDLPYYGNACRVFFDKEDVAIYKDMVMAKEKLPAYNVKIWDCPIEDLIDFLLKTSDKKGTEISAVTSVIRGNGIHEIDTFWSPKDELMV
jgi:hypothetical protein